MESLDQVMQVMPSPCAFSKRRTHCPLFTRQILINPSCEPLAKSSLSLLKATAMTAFSCIMKLPEKPSKSTSSSRFQVSESR